MEDINDNRYIELEYATKLFNQKILPGRGHCDCGHTNFSLQIYENLKISGVVFRCSNNRCRKRYPIKSIHFFHYFQK